MERVRLPTGPWAVWPWMMPICRKFTQLSGSGLLSSFIHRGRARSFRFLSHLGSVESCVRVVGRSRVHRSLADRPDYWNNDSVSWRVHLRGREISSLLSLFAPTCHSDPESEANKWRNAQRQLDLDSDDNYNWTRAEGEAGEIGRPSEVVWSQTNR